MITAARLEQADIQIALSPGLRAGMQIAYGTAKLQLQRGRRM